MRDKAAIGIEAAMDKEDLLASSLTNVVCASKSMIPLNNDTDLQRAIKSTGIAFYTEKKVVHLRGRQYLPKEQRQRCPKQK